MIVGGEIMRVTVLCRAMWRTLVTVCGASVIIGQGARSFHAITAKLVSRLSTPRRLPRSHGGDLCRIRRTPNCVTRSTPNNVINDRFSLKLVPLHLLPVGAARLCLLRVPRLQRCFGSSTIRPTAVFPWSSWSRDSHPSVKFFPRFQRWSTRP